MIDNLIKRFESARKGSALIMTIVLTVLLAIVAVMFLTVARMDRASTSNIADNKTLDSAAKSIIAIINKELINDTPGVATPTQEYYDYPDAENPWLASIEPYLYDTTEPNIDNYDVYRWRQISDVTGYIKDHYGENARVDVSVRPSGSKVIKEYPEITLTGNNLNEHWADADGDGIADSKWFELENLRSSKGQRIYAAVRVIDHGGMINVNTAHTFNPDSTDITEIDGKSQMQVNLKGLLRGADDINNLHNARLGTAGLPQTWADYEKNVIWDYNSVPDGNYLPFDISDELELRYRYCIDSKFVSRIESVIPETTDAYGDPGGLYNTDPGWGLGDWQHRITEPDYSIKADRRHMLTTVNYDRIITPAGGKMVNVNDANVNALYDAIHTVIPDGNTAAQIAVNIIDYRDPDPNITVLRVNDVNYYGFERPCVYISELAFRTGPNDVNSSYAVEFYKPYDTNDDPNGWKLLINSNTYDINWSGNKQFHVIAWQDYNCPLFIDPAASKQEYDNSDSNTVFAANDTISLIRDVNGVSLVVDSVKIPDTWPAVASDVNSSFQRDITKHKCIMRLWGAVNADSATLGTDNSYSSTDANMIQAHPKNNDFTNIGEIGMIFRKPAYYPLIGASAADINNTIGYSTNTKAEIGVRLNLAEADYQHIFKYLTVWPPSYVSDPNETRIKGRININTAPAYVIAQLPWVSRDVNDPSLSKAIVAYRDMSGSDPNCNYSTRSGAAGFENIGQLCNIIDGDDPNFGIDYYKRVGGDQTEFPDLTPSDGAADDFEERDLIFARISDLVTVRSDVFTAYILVRVGVDGPQKRYIAILDRTGVESSADRVRIIAFQSVPEAR